MAGLKNVTTGEMLAREVEVASSHWARFRGLMLRASLPDGRALVIQPCRSIHMMFMRFRIDAVFYDRSYRVTHVTRDARPWIGLAFGGRGAFGVVELPRGVARGTERGHLLSFEDLPGLG